MSIRSWCAGTCFCWAAESYETVYQTQPEVWERSGITEEKTWKGMHPMNDNACEVDNIILMFPLNYSWTQTLVMVDFTNDLIILVFSYYLEHVFHIKYLLHLKSQKTRF